MEDGDAYGARCQYRWTCIKLSHAFINACFPIRAMNDLASDTVPLVVRGFLLILVACLHVAGAAVLSNLSSSTHHDEEPMILRASWIENPLPASSLLSPSLVPRSTEPLPITRPVPPLIRPRTPTPSRPQPAAVQSAIIPAAVDAAPAVPVEPPTQANSSIDVSLAVTAAVAGGTFDRSGDDRSGEGNQDKDYAGPDSNVSYFSNPEPEYPPQSRRLREQGLVKLRVHVTEQGRAGEVMLYKSSGYERLDKAALNAVWQWRFRPAQRAGTPVAGWVVVPFRFELQS
ncbi:MAG: energy transducer TonB [Betaproteobacteria bacterium]|nr:energy transducer TonB [Betaproteobacteria bacterium]